MPIEPGDNNANNVGCNELANCTERKGGAIRYAHCTLPNGIPGKVIEVAAAVLQKPDGSFLLAQRPPDKIWAGYWEFPGGKIEPGETPYHALVRELREELGIEVQTAYPWVTRVFAYPHAAVRLNFFRVTKWGGELHPHEGQQFAWQHTSSSFPRKRESSGSIKLDSRLRGITRHLPACGLSGMASCFTNDGQFQ